MSDTYQPEVPDAVRRSAKAADDAIRALREAADAAAKNPAAADPAANEPPPTPDAPQNPPQNPPQNQPGAESSFEQPKPDAQPAPPATPAPQDDALKAALERAEKAEQDARTWRGRADAQAKQIGTIQAEMQEMRAALESLKAAPAAPAAPAVGLQPLDEREIEDFGADLMAAVARHAHATVAPIIKAEVAAALASIRTEFEPVKADAKAAAESAVRTAQEKFYDALDAGFKGWRDLDRSQAFVDWVNQYDALIGATRMESLDKAIKALDSDRVIAFFRAYVDQHKAPGSQAGQPAPDQSSPPPGNPPASDEGSDPPPSLADLAAPGKARGAAPDTGGKRVWTLSEIKDHSNKIARGLYAGNPGERDRLDREIALAQKEGRVDLSR